jgi:hypothetical protein
MSSETDVAFSKRSFVPIVEYDLAFGGGCFLELLHLESTDDFLTARLRQGVG